MHASMQYAPFVFLFLIATAVGILQWQKSRRFDGLKRRLALMVAGSNLVTAVTVLFVIAAQYFDKPGPGPVIILSILLSIALWTASLIWAGPAEAEDRWVYKSTVGLVTLMFASAVLAGLTS